MRCTGVDTLFASLQSSAFSKQLDSVNHPSPVMPDPVLITEILRRANTGVSVTPFICRTEEGRVVYVKPAGTLSDSLIFEWIGSSLAKEMGLPVAEFCLTSISDSLVDHVVGIDLSGIKAGIGFGSYDVGTGSRDMESRDLDQVSSSELAEILLFDLWIQNGDRILTKHGGNPNAVVGHYGDDLFLIDHDNAFEEGFSLASFDELHLGWAQRFYWKDEIERDFWLGKAERALEKVPQFWAEMPPEWLENSLRFSQNPDRALDSLCAILKTPFERPDDFWSLLLSFSKL